MNSGYVYVASCNSEYYRAAIRSAISLRDYYPEAKIALFTHGDFLKTSDEKYFDYVRTGIPVNERAKMYGMARTPFDRTFYMDCDTEIRSDNIKNVFDILGDRDIMFTKIIPQVSKDTYIDADNALHYHGGVVLYNNQPLTIQLMRDWYEFYQHQQKCDWPDSIFAEYSEKMRPWDQFTMWYLLYKYPKYKSIKHDFFPDGGTSYNFIYLLEERKEKYKDYYDLEQIVYHYTIPGIKKENAIILKSQSRSSEDFN